MNLLLASFRCKRATKICRPLVRVRACIFMSAIMHVVVVVVVPSSLSLSSSPSPSYDFLLYAYPPRGFLLFCRQITGLTKAVLKDSAYAISELTALLHQLKQIYVEALRCHLQYLSRITGLVHRNSGRKAAYFQQL